MEQTLFSLKSITDQSIFGEYKNAEDRLTAALLQVMHYGGHPLIAYLFGDILDLPSNDVNIIPQSVQNDSRPDGEIRCNCQYQIFIENKIIPNAVNDRQLANHCKLVNPDDTKPQKLELLSGFVEWISWDNVSDVLEMFLSTNSNELLKFLIRQLILLIANTVKKKIKKTVKSKSQKDSHDVEQILQPHETVIIVGGRWGENIASKYNFYACQENRFFLDASYIAFYHQNRIKELFRIIGKPINSIDIHTCPEISKVYFSKEEPNYHPQKRKLFLLEHVHTFNPEISNDKVDKNGHSCAFVQRQTYTTYDRIMSATYTSEL